MRFLVQRVVMAGAALALAGCMAMPALETPVAPSPTPSAPAEAAPAAATVIAGLDPQELRIIEVYRRYSPAVVNINTQVLRSDFFYGVYPEEGSGSGFVWDDQGRILTNYHVIEGANQITVSFGEGQERTARVVGVDPPNDLAVLQVDDLPEGIEPMPLGDSDALVVGQFAIAIGNPFGQFERTLTVGVVSAVNRTLRLDNDRLLRGVVQTDASINRGNSGGPLLDSRGQLIGVNTAIFSPTGASAGVGLAIPVNKLKLVVPVLIAEGRFPHPWLGIEGLGYELSPDLSRALELPVEQGLLLARLYRDSPAERAGLRTATQTALLGFQQYLIGGDILTAIDGMPLASWDDLRAYLDEQAEVGQTVRLTVWRDGQPVDVNVTVGQEPF